MKGAEDEEIIREAVAEKRVIVTNDKGFGRLARFYQPAGIVLLRLKDESAENKAKLVTFLVTNYAERIGQYHSCF
jgi:predicted nuclease of predicted toxin-antitoxin system